MEDAKKVRYKGAAKSVKLTRMREGKKLMTKGGMMEDKGEDLMYKYGSAAYRAEQDAKNPVVKELPEDAMDMYGSEEYKMGKKMDMAKEAPADAMDTYGSDEYKAKRKKYKNKGGN